MFYISQELNNNYKEYKVYLACNADSKDKLKAMLEKYKLTRIKLVSIHTLKYYKILARVKFIFTDTSVSTIYTKREEQVLVNTWHGTPLKKMGRPEDVAQAVLFLAGDASEYITGQVLCVDGGMAM